MRKSTLFMALVLSGCAAQPTGFFYYANTGKIVSQDSKDFEKFSIDRAVCDGQAAQSALVSKEKFHDIHSRNVTLVFHGCMAEKGYIVKQTASQ